MPVGDVTAGVSSAGVPDTGVGLPANELGIAPGTSDIPVPATPNEGVAVVEPCDVVIGLIIEKLRAPDEDVLPLPVDILELITGDWSGATGVSNSEIPLLPSTDPVWTLEMGLHGTVLVTAGGGLGGAVGGGVAGTCAAAVVAHAMPIPMNSESLIGT